MPRRSLPERARSGIFHRPVVQPDEPEASLLDVIDNVLNKGAVLDGDLVLGVANVDLIYARLSVLLAAFDRAVDEPSVGPVAAARKRERTGRNARAPRRTGRRAGKKNTKR